MVSFLALAPVKLVVWSNEAGFSPLTINAHPKSTVLRLLEYVHDRCGLEGPVGGFELMHEGKELNLEVFLQSVAISSESSFVKLELKKRLGEVKLVADSKLSNFTNLNLRVIVNAFSMDKIYEASKDHLSIHDSTISQVQEFAISKLNEYENNCKSSYCDHDYIHSTSDCVSLKFEGRQSPESLTEDGQLIGNMTLSEAIGIDFIPQDMSTFTIFIKIAHSYSAPKNHESHILDIISNSHLYTKKMFITNNTTVNDVKEFISSNYLQILNVCRSEVKLIYKGRLVKTHDEENDPAKIMEVLQLKNNETDSKIHVQISSQSMEPDIEFWDNLFVEPIETLTEETNIITNEQNKDIEDDARGNKMAEMVESVVERDKQITNQHRQVDQLDDELVEAEQISEQNVTDGSVSQMIATPLNSPLVDIKTTSNQFTTESDEIISSTGTLYEKCIINGEEVFIEHSKFETTTNKLLIEGDVLNINEEDYFITNGIISLSPRLISILEEKYNLDLQQAQLKTLSAFDDRVHLHGSQSEGDEGDDETEGIIKLYIPNVETLFEVILTILKTLYFVGINGIAPLVFVYEFYLFLPLQVVFPIGLFILFRIVWSTQEIWDLWIPYIRRHRIISRKQYIDVKEYVQNHQLNRDFYSSCSGNDQIIKDLLVPELELQRFEIYSSLNIVLNDTTTDDDSNTLKESINKMLADEQYSMELLEELMLECIGKFKPGVVSQDELQLQDSIKEVIAFISNYKNNKAQRTNVNDSQINRGDDEIGSQQRVPLTIYLFQKLRDLYGVLMNSERYVDLLEMFIPYPGRDSLIAQVIKNVILFVLVLIPPIKSMADGLIDSHRIHEVETPNQQIYVSSENIAGETTENTTTGSNVSTEESRLPLLEDVSDQEQDQSEHVDTIENTEALASGVEAHETLSDT